MKLVFLFCFSMLYHCSQGQKNIKDTLIVGKWELIAHEKTPKKIVTKNNRIIEFFRNGTYKFFYKNAPNNSETGIWKINNNSLSFFDNSLGYWSDLDYKIYFLNKTTLVIDEVFYYEELAKSTYKRIK